MTSPGRFIIGILATLVTSITLGAVGSVVVRTISTQIANTYSAVSEMAAGTTTDHPDTPLTDIHSANPQTTTPEDPVPLTASVDPQPQVAEVSTTLPRTLTTTNPLTWNDLALGLIALRHLTTDQGGTTRTIIERSVGDTADNLTTSISEVSSTLTTYQQAQETAITTATLTVSGDTTIDGTLTAGSLSVAGISSGGAITAPYFTATSTTATTTLAGHLTTGGTVTFSALTAGLLYANGAGQLSASSTISSSLVEDVYLRNDGDDATSGHLTAGGFTTTGTSTLATTTISGNLGIGITPHSSLLAHFYATGGIEAIQRIESTGGAGMATLQFRAGTHDIGMSLSRANNLLSIAQQGSAGDNVSILLDATSAGTAGSQLYLARAGNVGIGDTTPTSLLTVGASDAFQVTSLGRVLANAGAAGADNLAYSFVGDTDTGIYNAAVNEVRLQTGGADRLTVTSGGNVGIGTILPDELLHVSGNTNTGIKITGGGSNAFLRVVHGVGLQIQSGAGDMIATFHTGSDALGLGTDNPQARLHLEGSNFVDSSIRFLNTNGSNTDYWSVGERISGGNEYFSFERNDDPKMVIFENGNVGIGDTTPASLLTVGASDAFQVTSAGRVLANAGASGAGNLAYSFVGDTDTGFYRSATDEIRFQTAGSDRVTIDADGNVGVGISAPEETLHVTGAVGLIPSDAGQTGYSKIVTSKRNGNTANADLQLHTSAGALMTLHPTAVSGGGIGIGTGSPTSKLHILDNTTAANVEFKIQTSTGAPTITLDANTAIKPVIMNFMDSGARQAFFLLGRGDIVEENGFLLSTAVGTSNKLYLGTESTPRLTVDAAGNVGIGTTTPVAKLSVSGDIYTDGNLTVSGITATTTISAPYFTATDAAATSTFAGGLNVGSGGLVYDRATGRVGVGIGANSPTGTFDILSGSTGNDMNVSFSEKGENIQQITFKEAGIGFFGIVHDGQGVNPGNLFKIVASSGGDDIFNVDALTVSQNGNIGVGTTNSSSKLTVKQSSDGSIDGGLLIVESAGVYGGGIYREAGNHGALIFRNNSFDTIALKDGNVGIGDTTPASLLTVGASDAFQVTSAGRVLANAGASGAGNLAYSFVGDTDTGLYRSAANEVRLQTGGADRVTVDASGRVGIGTTTPGYSLDLGATTGRRLALYNSGSHFYGFGISSGKLEISAGKEVGDDPDIVVTNSGNVGIGTVSPSAPLTVQMVNAANGYVQNWFNSSGERIAGLYNEEGSSDSAGFILFDTDTDTVVTKVDGRNGSHSYFNNGGNVGIGDTTPASLLTVGSGDAFQVTSAGRVLANAGASGAGNLAYSFVGDTNTGLYNAAADEIRFQTNGTDRFAINSAGKVFIGSAILTSPDAGLTIRNGHISIVNNSDAWLIEGSRTDGNSKVGLRITNQANSALNLVTNDANRVTVTKDGDVGIDTTSPGTRLSITSRPNTAKSQINLLNYRANIYAGSILGGIDFLSNDPDTPAGGALVSYVRAIVAQSHGATALGTHLVFGVTANGTSTPAEAMRITHDGKIGIATTTPEQKLSVAGTVGFHALTGATGAGSLCLSSDGEVVYNATSDACLPSLRDTKNTINPLTLNALDTITAIEAVSFVYNDSDGRTRYGFIAEDVALVDTLLATYDAEGSISGIDDRSMLAVVVKGVQELWEYVTGRFDSQDEKIEQLEQRIRELEQNQGIDYQEPADEDEIDEDETDKGNDDGAGEGEAGDDDADDGKGDDADAADTGADDPQQGDGNDDPLDGAADEGNGDEAGDGVDPNPTDSDDGDDAGSQDSGDAPVDSGAETDDEPDPAADLEA